MSGLQVIRRYPNVNDWGMDWCLPSLSYKVCKSWISAWLFLWKLGVTSFHFMWGLDFCFVKCLELEHNLGPRWLIVMGSNHVRHKYSSAPALAATRVISSMSLEWSPNFSRRLGRQLFIYSARQRFSNGSTLLINYNYLLIYGSDLISLLTRSIGGWGSPHYSRAA